jgi:hypothetical protein
MSVTIKDDRLRTIATFDGKTLKDDRLRTIATTVNPERRPTPPSLPLTVKP